MIFQNTWKGWKSFAVPKASWSSLLQYCACPQRFIWFTLESRINVIMSGDIWSQSFQDLVQVGFFDSHYHCCLVTQGWFVSQARLELGGLKMSKRGFASKTAFWGTRIWIKWLWNNCNWFFGIKRLQWLTSHGENFVIPSFNSFLTRAGWLWMAILSPWPWRKRWEYERGASLSYQYRELLR